MSNYIKYRNNLIKNGINILIIRNILMFDDYLRNRIFRNQINFIQEGGSSRKVKFEGKYYKFNKSVLDNNEVIYVLESKNDSVIDCVIISIVDKIAYIIDIGNNKGCVKKNKIVNGGGTKLMNIVLKLIKKKLKEKHNLKYLYLSDTAKKDIYDDKNKNYKVDLSKLLFFTKGYTYYERFSFLPIVQTSNGLIISKSKIKDYSKEKKKILELRIKDIDLSVLKENIEKKHLYLLKKLLDNRLKEKKIVNVIKYMLNNCKYYPILNDTINYITNKAKIDIPKLWGIKL